MRRFLRQAFVVFRKELRDSSRDRRAMFAIAFGAAIGPLVIAFMVDRIADRQRAADEMRLPIAGADHAPALVAWLGAQPGIRIVRAPSDPEAAVRAGDENVIVEITPEFGRRFQASRPAEVRLVLDSSRDSARPEVTRARLLLQQYSSEIGALRLVAHGVSPQVVSTLRVDDVEVSTPQGRAAAILNFLGLFLLLSALSGGMQLATDSTAGERERGSLEPLLVNPVSRGALVLGKGLAATAASFIAVALTMGLCVLLLKRVLAPDLGIRLTLGAPQLFTILIAALSVCPLASALQALVGTFSRSFKEAQSYTGILMTLPVMAIGIAGALYPVGTQPWMYAVPLLSQYMLVKSAVAGEAPGVAAYLLTTVVSIGTAALLFVVMGRMFRSERIVFGR